MGKFLCNKMAELVTEVEESVQDVFRSICIQDFLGGLKIAKLLRYKSTSQS